MKKIHTMCTLHKALVLLCLIGLSCLAGCGGILNPGPPPKRMQLYPAFPEPVSVGSRVKNQQLIVALPKTGSDMDTDAVALLFNKREIRYLSGVRWARRVPQLLQANLIEALERTEALRGVVDESAGIAGEWKLFTDLRLFALRYTQDDGVPQAYFSATFRLVNLSSGEVRATLPVVKILSAQGKDTEALLEACEKNFSAVLAEVCPWILESLAAQH